MEKREKRRKKKILNTDKHIFKVYKVIKFIKLL